MSKLIFIIGYMTMTLFLLAGVMMEGYHNECLMNVFIGFGFLNFLLTPLIIFLIIDVRYLLNNYKMQKQKEEKA